MSLQSLADEKGISTSYESTTKGGAMVAQAHTATALCHPTLRGVAGVAVRVARLQPAVERTGVSAPHLTTAVEGQLREARIPVLTAHEALTVPGRPSLVLHVHIAPRSAGLAAYTVSVVFQQRVARVPAAALATVVTWSVGSTGRLGSAPLAIIHTTVRDHVDQFISAYLSVNPRPVGRAIPAAASPRRDFVCQV
jgi:hypothetical protein